MRIRFAYRFYKLAVIGLATASVAGASPEDGASWPRYQPVISELDQYSALARKFPNSSAVQERRLDAAVRWEKALIAEEAARALAVMGATLNEGLDYRLSQTFKDTDPWVEDMKDNGRRVGTSSVYATIGPQHRLVEGVAWDDRNQRLYASSVVDRSLLLLKDGKWQAVPGIDGGALTGLAIDEARRILWIGSGRLEEIPNAENAFVGLIGYHLDRGEAIHRVAGPAEAKTLSDLGIAPDGTVYISDTIGGGVYRLRPGSTAMEVAVPVGLLRNPQGIAVHPSGKQFYVSDHPFGVAIVNLEGSGVRRLTAGRPMMLDGIDGLYWKDGSLIGIQNGTSPHRIVRIRLDAKGMEAVGIDVIEANNPDWGEPTLGQIVGNDLIYVSDPQWFRFGPNGTIKGEQWLHPNRIRRVRLN